MAPPAAHLRTQTASHLRAALAAHGRYVQGLSGGAAPIWFGLTSPTGISKGSC